MRRVRDDFWPDVIQDFRERGWPERALFVLNLDVESLDAAKFRRTIEEWDRPVTYRSLRQRSDQRDEIALLQRIGEGMTRQGYGFERGDLDRFLRLLRELNLEPPPIRVMTGDPRIEVAFEPTPRNLTFGGRFWPSVGSAVLLLYLTMAGFIGPRLCRCFLWKCSQFFFSEKSWALYCCSAHRVAGHREEKRIRKALEESERTAGAGGEGAGTRAAA